MTMRSHQLIFTLGVLVSAFSMSCAHKNDAKPVDPQHQTQAAASLTSLAEFRGVQVTGVTISSEGRLFANFPRWREGLPFSVVEVAADGTFKPYPDSGWNDWKGLGQPKKNQFNTVQSVVAHGDSLWVLDPSSPFMKGVVGKAKLFQFDLKTNKLVKTYEFTDAIAPRQSYLNDLRVDEKAQAIYITDSGLGGLVVLDLKSGKSRRLLTQEKAVKSEGTQLTVEGKLFTVGGKSPQIHSDGIALSPDHNYVYFHALTGETLYRVPTAALNDKKLKAKDLAKTVENLGKTVATDGMIFDENGNLYMGDLQNNAIVYRTPDGAIQKLAQDPRIKWADTFTIGKSSELIFTASRLHEAPAGTSADAYTFSIYRVPLAGVSEYK